MDKEGFTKQIMVTGMKTILRSSTKTNNAFEKEERHEK